MRWLWTLFLLRVTSKKPFSHLKYAIEYSLSDPIAIGSEKGRLYSGSIMEYRSECLTQTCMGEKLKKGGQKLVLFWDHTYSNPKLLMYVLLFEGLPKNSSTASTISLWPPFARISFRYLIPVSVSLNPFFSKTVNISCAYTSDHKYPYINRVGIYMNPACLCMGSINVVIRDTHLSINISFWSEHLAKT